MKQTLAFGAVALCCATGLAVAGELDATLQKVLDETAPDQIVSTLVHLTAQTDLPGMTRALDGQRVRLRERHEHVVVELRETAQLSQPALAAHLEALRGAGQIESYQAFWIVNAFRVDATPAQIAALAQRADVERVFYNPRITNITPVEERAQPAAGGGEADGGVAGGIEPGVVAVRAPECWALGYDGTGVLVSTLDTGVEGSHPALASRWRGLNIEYAGNPGWAFFDPVTNWTFPDDSSDHGTHTMGSVCGGFPGDQIGVAPGAQWIHAAVIDRVSIAQTISDAILAFQWIADPDENPGTFFDVPAVCSNSWGLADVHGVPDCDQTFWSFLDACEAAGVVILFSAGNEGGSGLRRPADRATDDYRTTAVAAVNGNVPNFPIANFSSLGPTQCGPGGSTAIKPDISAPGVDVRSSTPSGYGFKSGTSMASPHVNGVVALMRQANPDLGVEQIKEIIFATAQDLGGANEDNVFGWGMIDAFDAVQEALSTVALSISFPNGLPTWVNPLGGTVIQVLASGQSVQPMPDSGIMYLSIDGGDFAEVPMTEVSAGLYDAVLPAFPCGAHVQFYFSVQAETGELVYKPPSAPDVSYPADAWTGVNVSFVDNFEGQLGWTIANSPSLTAGQWQQGIPIGGGDRGDPPTDFDDSGQCFLTQNVDGDSDVDAGSTTLTSPNLDATAIENPIISYARWYSNVVGASPMQDTFLVEVSDNGGASWTTLEVVGPGGGEVGGSWFEKSFLIADHVSVTDSFRIRFTASDTDPQSVVEAGVDNVKISALYCDEPSCSADINGDGAVDVQDLVDVVLNFGPCPGCSADVNGDDVVDVQDMVEVVLAWGSCD